MLMLLKRLIVVPSVMSNALENFLMFVAKRAEVFNVSESGNNFL